MVNLTKLLRKAWDITENEESSEKAIANAIHVTLDCLAFKRQLLLDKTDLKFMEEQIRNEAELHALSYGGSSKFPDIFSMLPDNNGTDGNESSGSG
jgi:hypothetical protein